MKDLEIPTGVKALVPPETVIVTVTEKAKEEEAPTQATPTEGSQPSSTAEPTSAAPSPAK